MNTVVLDLDPFWERLSLANRIQLDEVVARHYRTDVPVLLERIHALEVMASPHPLTLDEFSRLPALSIVMKMPPYMGEFSEPEIWQRHGSGNYWVGLTDGGINGDEYTPDAAYSDGAVHLIIWQPTTDEPKPRASAIDDQITEALAAHQSIEAERGGAGGVDCVCGWQDSQSHDFAEHLSEAIVRPIIKARLAEAWDEGVAHGIAFQAGGSWVVNPYRTEAVDACLVTGLSPCPWHPGGGNHPEAGK